MIGRRETPPPLRKSMMSYKHSYSSLLFDVQRTAFCELIAWGFPKARAQALCGLCYDTSNASKAAASPKNAIRIEGLKAKPADKREWEYAFAALIIDGRAAVSAYRSLGKGAGCSPTALRKRASRALLRPAVKFAVVELSKHFQLTPRLTAYVDRYREDANKHWTAKNRVRLLIAGRGNARRLQGGTETVYPNARAEELKLRNAAGKHICGAKTRSGNGAPCQRKPLPGKKRCALHGGLSTGPKTVAGKARSSQNARRRPKVESPQNKGK